VADEKNDELFDAWLRLKYGSLQPGETVTLPVLSGSMLPLLVPGRDIKIQGVSYRDSTKGDIIVYKDNNRLSAHRLLLRLRIRGKDYIFQKGDAIDFGSWIPAGQVVGIVVETKDTNGNIIDFRSEEEIRKAKSSIHKHLATDIQQRILVFPRLVKRMLKKIVRCI